jgi:DNA gyrase subunit A
MRDADELMLITSQGKIVRMGLTDMRIIGRATQGVRFIALREGDKLVSVARVVSDDNTQGELDMPPGDEDEPDSKLFRPQNTGIGDEEAEEEEIVNEEEEEEIVDEEAGAEGEEDADEEEAEHLDDEEESDEESDDEEREQEEEE